LIVRDFPETNRRYSLLRREATYFSRPKMAGKSGMGPRVGEKYLEIQSREKLKKAGVLLCFKDIFKVICVSLGLEAQGSA